MASEETMRLLASALDGNDQKVITDMAQERLDSIAQGPLPLADAFMAQRDVKQSMRATTPLDQQTQRNPLPGELPEVEGGPQPQDPFLDRVAGGAVRGGFKFAEFVAALRPNNPEAGFLTATEQPGVSGQDTQAIPRAIDRAGDATLRAMNFPEEAVPGDIANLLGEEIPFVAGGVLGPAIRSGVQARRAARAAGLIESVGGPARAAGSTLATKETAIRAGGEVAAGSASAGGRSLTQSQGAGAETAAGIGAPLALLGVLKTFGVSAAAINRFRKGADGLTREEAILEAKKIMDRNLHPNDQARAKEAIDEAMALEKKVPGFEAPSGGASADANLQGLQDDILRDVDPGSKVGVGDVERARLSSATAVSRALRDSGPPPGRSNVDVARARAQESAQETINDLNATIDDAAEQLGGDPATFSSAQRDELAQLHLEASGQVDDVYDDLDNFADTQTNAVLPAEPMLDAVKRATAKKAVGTAERPLLQPLQPLLATIRRELSTFDEAGNVTGTKPMTFELLRSISRRINKHYRDGDAPPKALGELFGGVRDTRAALRGLDPDLAERYAQADAYAAELNLRYREGISGKIFSPNSTVANSSTMDMFFVPGNKGRDAALQYRNSFQDVRAPAAADENMVKWIVAKAAFEAGDSPARLKRFTDKYAAALNVFPEAKKKITNMQVLANNVEQLGIKSPKTAEQFQRGAATLFIEHPHTAVQGILKLRGFDAQVAARKLLARTGGDETAKLGLQRVFQDVMEAEAMSLDPTNSISAGGLYSGRPEVVDGGKLRLFVDTNEKVIDTFFGSGHADRLREISAAAELAASFPTAVVSGQARDAPKGPFQAVVGSGMLARIGRMTIRVARTAVNLRNVSKRFGREAGERIIRESILDKELAKLILTPDTAHRASRIEKIMTARGVTLPGRAIQAGVDEREQSAGGIAP